ncbi:MAG: magnesium transporter [Anaerolineales bacterium]
MTVNNRTPLEERILNHLDANDLKGFRKTVKKAHPADIAEALDRLAAPQRRHAFSLLEVKQRAEVVNEFSVRVARQVLDGLSVKEIAEILDRLPMDEAARIIAAFRRRRPAILKAMHPHHAADVKSLLRYPAESAGLMMTEQFARLRPEMSAQQALSYLRRVNADVETLTNLYIVNRQNQLIGVVSLREVVVAPPKSKLKDLMNADVISVSPETDREEVARLISRYDFLAMPVVGADGRMLGVITADDVIDVLAAENAEDFLKFGAVGSAGLAEESYFTVPIKTVIARRLGWLLLLFVAGTLTGSVLRFFEAELATVVALSFFIPLLIGTGGNTGAQTVSTLIRGMATGDVHMRDIWRVIRREFLSGMLIGAILGVVAFGRALLWNPDPALATAVALAIMAICAWSNTIAALIPLLAQRFKIDPAAVSAPLITTLVDATGLTIYLFIAKATLGL